MTAPRPRTKAELWDALEAVADEGELARIDALADDAVDAELRAAGASLDDVDRVGRGLVGRAPKRRAPVVLWLAAAALAALILIVVLAWRWDTVARPPPERRPDVQGALEEAAKLRDEAFRACGQASWSACAGKLDEARDLDPDGEDDRGVQRARAAIRESLRDGEAAPTGTTRTPGSPR